MQAVKNAVRRNSSAILPNNAIDKKLKTMVRQKFRMVVHQSQGATQGRVQAIFLSRYNFMARLDSNFRFTEIMSSPQSKNISLVKFGKSEV